MIAGNTNKRNTNKNTQPFKSDVAVVGGGVAGLAAAVAAARMGADTCLIERYGFLGGTATAGLVGRFQAGPDVKGKPVIMGLYREICDRLKGYDALRGGLFDPEMMKYVAIDLCEEAGVRLLLHSTVFEVKKTGGHVDGLRLITRGGPVESEASTYVDATGDGSVCALAGAEYRIGRDIDGLTQPMTLLFQLGNIDQARIKSADWDRLSEIFRAEIEGLAYRSRIFFFEFVEGFLGFVISHVSHSNPLDVQELSRAEVTSRRQALDVLRFFRKHVPGCERCVMASTATEIGVRESRRILGDYVLTREDILGARKFDDSIGCSTSWIDLHNPEGRGVLHQLILPDDWFEVPFRTITVKGFENLLVAGRSISATHEAQGAIREMPTCIAVGQGAGVAAALAARDNIPVRRIDVAVLQKALSTQGVKLRDR
ncbi:MAG TPA: FAD-dependent oxidoreductase [Spirochaetia bacterium]|nr:FAD-dependent oxidoreductase [Spirochaetia bacterium]